MGNSDGRIRRIVVAAEDAREDHDANRPAVSRIVRPPRKVQVLPFG
jgi:hypothetical protein